MSASPAIRAAFAGMFALTAAMGIGRFVYTPILPLMLADGALDPSQAGLVAGANYLGYLLGALTAASSLFTKKRRVWLLAGLSASVLTTTAMALPLDVAAIAVIRFLSGVASAFAMIFVTSIVMAWLVQEDREEMIALYFGGVGVGIAASAVMVSLLAANSVHWTLIWAWAGIAGLVAVMFAITLLPKNAPRPSASELAGKGEPRFSRALWTYIAGYGFFGFGYVITATFINALAKSEPALQPVEPWVWAVVGLAGFPSIWLWNKFARRFGSGTAFAAACILEAAGVGLSVTVLTPAVLLVSAVLLGGTFMAITAMGLARARLMTAGSPARAIALMTASFGLGQMIGPVIAGWLFERVGSLFPASMMAAAALVVSAVLVLAAERMHHAD